jgi:hypothetical protein
MSGIFDPSEQETEELLPKNESDMSDYTEDTSADPEGAEQRSVRADIVVADWWHRKFALTDHGQPTFKLEVVQAIMDIFDKKFGTSMTFKEIKLPNGEVMTVEDQQAKYQEHCQRIIDGTRVELGVDPETTGLSLLGRCTKTWSEFASITYEYFDTMQNLASQEDLPDWVYEREAKMFDLGRKARLLTDALLAVDQEFGNLKNVSIQRDRVEVQVKDRQQRLAEYNFKKQADTSGRTRRQLNEETVAHMQSIVDDA